MLREHLITLKEKTFALWGHRLFVVFALVIAVLIGIALVYSALFGPPSKDALPEDFVVTPDATLASVGESLAASGFVKNEIAFRIAYEAVRGEASIRPGGYALSRSMDAFAVAKKLAEAPRLAWVVVPVGVRKEELGDILTDALGWTEAQRVSWLTEATELGDEFSEGVYYPDTYLIPSEQTPVEIAARMRGRFEEVYAPYMRTAQEMGKDWQEVVTLASLIEKEAARNDKHLVSGILTNRLEKNMKLQVDATLQYIAATPEDWWPLPDPEDKDMDSPFNTYKYEGLPPRPIATPSQASIEAALNPQKTSCLYYLHDARGRIHCSPTYAGHRANVARYLR